MIFKPHDYQKFAIEHIIKNPYSGLFLEMGLGKTVTTLTAIDELMNNFFAVDKVLIVAPLRVAEDTWPSEIKKWDHLKHLTVSKILGSEAQRLQALKVKADLYVINRENIPWLVGLYGRGFPFDMVVIDELSSFKSSKANRFRALKSVRPYVNRVVGLTGTPAPNSLIDLWSQMYLLDMGARLGKSVTSYRNLYFTPGRGNGQIVFDYRLNIGGEQLIYNKISDICVSMKSEDYLKMPERIERTIDIKLPEKTRKLYDQFEKQSVLQLVDREINAACAAALTNKLLQFANGAVYDDDGVYKEMHKAKLNALEDIIDAANQSPALVFYGYKHDLLRIHKHLAKYKPRELKTSQDIKDWNDGKIQLLLAHPASTGHGLNLQAGGNIIVWFGLTWSLELYQQANARLHRQGQNKTVIVHRLVATGTVDQDVITAIENKATKQDALMQAVKARIKKWLGSE